MALTISYARTLGAAFGVNTSIEHTQFWPDVLGLSNRGFVSAYNNYFSDTDPSGFVALNFYDSNFNAVSTLHLRCRC